MLKSKELFLKRARRNRQAIRKKSDNKLRLSVFRSSKNIYAQLIDDELGNNKPAAAAVGKLVAERALKEGLNNVVFDRGGYRYHGRVKALAEGARDAGLKF